MEKNKLENIPKHIGIIINGNEEWAKERNLSLLDGLKMSYAKIAQLPQYFFVNGVKTISFYVFGNNTWDLSQENVNKFMKLTRDTLDSDFKDLDKDSYRVIFSGNTGELPGDINDLCLNIQNKTAINKNGTINLCLNYNGKTELLNAVKKIVKNNISIDQIHEGIINKYIYNGGLGEMDLIIQTAGKANIKNCSLWQSNNAELIFLKKFWPDFEKSDIEVILNKYNQIKNK